MDLEALETALLRLAAVVETHDEILEFEMNPLVAKPTGVVAMDARIRVGVPFRPDSALREGAGSPGPARRARSGPGARPSRAFTAPCPAISAWHGGRRIP